MPRLAVLLAALLLPPTALAATYEIYPPAGCTGTEEFETVANSLNPGDELILHDGTYCQTGRRFISCVGEETRPIVIRAADGETPVLTRPDDPTGTQNQNGIEIYGEHLVIRGLHFEHGSAGVRLQSGSHHVTIEDCEISQTANNALTLNSGDTDSCIIRRNHIHHTGLLDSAHGTTEGEGLYVGCNSAGCIASNHLIEGNYIHDLRATSGGGNDGIEIKYGSFGNTIRDNVIHTTNIGTAYPCVFVYGTQDANQGSPNVVEGNALWSCGEAIQVVSDAVVRNNLILDSNTGITASSHAQVPVMRNVSIVNNTIAGHQNECLYMRWSGTSNMVLANNAVYCAGGTALNASGLSTATVKANYVQGSGAAIDNDAFFDGGTIQSAFVDAASQDYWPAAGSPLLSAAEAAHAPQNDFNHTPRTNPYDVGAYETEGLSQNPGWQVQDGFKQTVPDNTPPAAPTGLTVQSL